MAFIRKLISSFEKRADEINPLIFWQIRRYCGPGGSLTSSVAALVGVSIFTVIVDRGISSFEDKMQTVAALGQVGGLVIAFACSFMICNPGWCHDDEMMRLTALTRQERCYANLILPLIPPLVLFCTLTPLYMVFAFFGVSFWTLFASFAIPLLLATVVFPIWFSFVWFIWKGPKKIKIGESHIWQASVIYVVFWCIAIGRLYGISRPNGMSPDEFYRMASPILFGELLVFTVALVAFCRFQLRRNLENRRKWLGCHCLFYGISMPLFFGVLWLYLQQKCGFTT